MDRDGEGQIEMEKGRWMWRRGIEAEKGDRGGEGRIEVERGG